MLAENALALPSSEAGLTLLEHLHANASKRCARKGFTAPKIMAINRETKEAVYTEVNCKQWDCAACGYRNARKWIARIIRGVKFYGGQWYFMTLTAHATRRGVEKSVKNLRDGWRLMYNRFLRAYGKFHYVKIFEPHKDGTLHLHLLTDLSLPYKTKRIKSKKTGKMQDEYDCRVLKDISAQVGIGYQCNYQPLENAGLAAWYVAKYLGKSIATTDFPKGLRRIQCSHRWQILPKLYDDENIDYVYVTNRTDMLLRAYNLWKFEDVLTFDAIAQADITSDDFHVLLERMN